MPRLSDSLPKYRKHRASGQAVVTLSGRDFYLGPHGTHTSRREYDRLIGEWLACGRQPLHVSTDQLTVAELCVRYSSTIWLAIHKRIASGPPTAKPSDGRNGTPAARRPFPAARSPATGANARPSGSRGIDTRPTRIAGRLPARAIRHSLPRASCDGSRRRPKGSGASALLTANGTNWPSGRSAIAGHRTNCVTRRELRFAGSSASRRHESPLATARLAQRRFTRNVTTIWPCRSLGKSAEERGANRSIS